MLFNSGAMASRCRDHILAARRDGQLDGSTPWITLYVIETVSHRGHNCHNCKKDVVYAVVCPPEACQSATVFWRLTGTGISSRQADNYLQNIFDLRPTPLDVSTIQRPSTISHPVYDVLRSRIAALVERTPANLPRPKKVTDSDVFLYQSGMSSIYHIHQLLLQLRGGESVILGFAYELTIKMMETYGPGSHFYAFGTESELDQLESQLEDMKRQGHRMQAIWCECPSNPLLRTVNLRRVRELAQKHGLVVVVDETIGSFANVDVLHVADIVISSLTKSFSGYGDVLAGR